MKLVLYNTLGRKKEAFKPINEKEVRMYSCGPTVYWYQHVGNMRVYVMADILKRVLEYNGYKVKHLMNYTDVGHLTSDADEGEDKMEKAAAKEGKSAQEIAHFYENVFEEDAKKLNILEPWKITRATEHIKEQIELIKILEKKGYTYKTRDGIYFDSSKFKNYGRLGLLNISGLEKGKRVAAGDKKHATDFALWKFSLIPGERQQEWQSPWGLGFPGWHIECSAMSMKYLGEHFDIHTGGEDHIPVHHTNEIAQSEAATGKKFVNYWIHGAFLIHNGEKVSKSKGGLFTISELENQGYDALSFRYLALLTHYRKPLNFTIEHLNAAQAGYRRLKRKISELNSKEKKDLSSYDKRFEEAINDDLNFPVALQVLGEMLDNPGRDSLKLVKKWDEVLGLDLLKKERKLRVPEDVQKLLNAREKARSSKLWSESDKIRDLILEKGFRVEDTSEGQKIEKI